MVSSSSEHVFDETVLWTPKNSEKTKMEQFRMKVNQKYGLNLGFFFSF